MNQTALNLGAIAVFGMTLSVLLGPLLQIDSTIPAIATFAVLSLYTVDTLGLQGKGISLVLDLVAGTSRQHRDRVLRHEAGHFLVAYLLGIPVVGYTLSAWEALKQGQPGQGGVQFADQELASQLEQRRLTAQLLERYCTVWMAGIAAEMLAYGNAEGGIEDREKVRTILAQIGQPSQNFAIKERFHVLQARHLLESERAAYDALVQAMEERASVAECYATIQQHRGQGEGVA